MAAIREFHYQADGAPVTVIVEPEGDRLRVQIGEQAFSVAATPGQHGRLDLEVDGRRLRAYVAADGTRQHVALGGLVWTLHKADPRRQRSGVVEQEAGSLRAAMPGRVLDVLVTVGDEVKKGETLVLLEAMKMELRIQAPRDGFVTRVGCQAGYVVEKGQMLIEMDAGR